mmetsp:Transcript_90287/g.258355  ORF Transcript_90287/g.258355 Transcript_90287/m.258355 type:complete len:272 (+) Transcript_90287:1549-2364(+)
MPSGNLEVQRVAALLTSLAGRVVALVAEARLPDQLLAPVQPRLVATSASRSAAVVAVVAQPGAPEQLTPLDVSVANLANLDGGVVARVAEVAVVLLLVAVQDLETRLALFVLAVPAILAQQRIPPQAIFPEVSITIRAMPWACVVAILAHVDFPAAELLRNLALTSQALLLADVEASAAQPGAVTALLPRDATFAQATLLRTLVVAAVAQLGCTRSLALQQQLVAFATSLGEGRRQGLGGRCAAEQHAGQRQQHQGSHFRMSQHPCIGKGP